MSQDFGERSERLRLDRRFRRALGNYYQRTLRPLLPVTGWVRYGGVIVAERRWGDAAAPRHWTPAESADVPSYENALLSGLSAALRPGDTVVVVGGGLGVTAAHAAAAVGETGRVICYEGSPPYARRVLQTAALNGVAARVAVECATVGAAIGVYAAQGERAAPVLAPAALPACDVLELDCEGAELQILAGMTIRPRVILVETHGMNGASTAQVRRRLEALGYGVQDLGVAEPRLAALCETNDVRVLSATPLT